MKITSLTKIALMTAIICILAPISIPIPFSPVMLTLCTLALYFSVYILSLKEAVSATALYILLGAFGLPVFSGYTGGIGKFAGPGGGYIVGYIFLTAISGFFVKKFPDSRVMQIAGAFLGTAVAYTIGTFWMARVTNAGFIATLPMGALVFLPLDIVKIFFAHFLGRKLKPYILRISR